MRAARPLDRFPLINTSVTEEARAALAHIYATPMLELIGREKTLRAIVNHCQLMHIRMSYGSYAANLRMQFPETNFASQIFSIRGKSEALLDGRSVTIDRDCSVVISPHATLTVTNNAEYERLVLSVDSASLASKLSAITGEACAASLKFHPVQSYLLPAAKALRSHFLFLVESMDTSTVPMSNFVLAEFEQTLMVMFLHANRHNYSHRLEQTPPDSSSHQVRRAEEYVEANWQQAITLETIAEVAGVSAFSLFRSFKKIRGLSPMEFVSEVRLRHAREQLQRPNAATTVAETAARCGFADLRRFMSDYVRAFGEHPSQTFRHARDPHRPSQ